MQTNPRNATHARKHAHTHTHTQLLIKIVSIFPVKVTGTRYHKRFYSLQYVGLSHAGPRFYNITCLDNFLSFRILS